MLNGGVVMKENGKVAMELLMSIIMDGPIIHLATYLKFFNCSKNSIPEAVVMKLKQVQLIHFSYENIYAE